MAMTGAPAASSMDPASCAEVVATIQVAPSWLASRYWTRAASVEAAPGPPPPLPKLPALGPAAGSPPECAVSMVSTAYVVGPASSTARPSATAAIWVWR